jgi:hypothetical protein
LVGPSREVVMGDQFDWGEQSEASSREAVTEYKDYVICIVLITFGMMAGVVLTFLIGG